MIITIALIICSSCSEPVNVYTDTPFFGNKTKPNDSLTIYQSVRNSYRDFYLLLNHIQKSPYFSQTDVYKVIHLKQENPGILRMGVFDIRSDTIKILMYDTLIIEHELCHAATVLCQKDNEELSIVLCFIRKIGLHPYTHPTKEILSRLNASDINMELAYKLYLDNKNLFIQLLNFIRDNYA